MAKLAGMINKINTLIIKFLIEKSTKKLKGCLGEEVAIMNTLTINLHLLMVILID